MPVIRGAGAFLRGHEQNGIRIPGLPSTWWRWAQVKTLLQTEEGQIDARMLSPVFTRCSLTVLNRNWNGVQSVRPRLARNAAMQRQSMIALTRGWHRAEFLQAHAPS